MVENIAVVGLNRQLSYEVAKMLASELEMNFLDCVELFEFDNIPRDLSTMLKEYGERYYRGKEKGTIKYVSGFNQTVINLESGMAQKDNFKVIKSNCLLVYLHLPLSVVKKMNAKISYKSKQEERFFNVSEEKLQKRIEKYKANADIIVNANGSALKVCSLVLRAIKNFYNVN